MAKNYIGKAPLTMVRTTAGSYVHVFAEDAVPADITDDDLKRLLDEGYIVEAPAAEDSADSDGGAPAKSATKADWEAYARSQGATDADLEGKTKDDLVNAYGES